MNVTSNSNDNFKALEKVNVSANGAIVYWQAADTNRDKLRAALEVAGLDKFMPDPREAYAVLRSSLKALAAEHKKVDSEVIVLPHKNHEQNGYDIQFVEKHEARNDVLYLGEAKIGDVGPEQSGALPWDFTQLYAQYQYQANHVSAAGVGKVLVNAVHYLGGVCLRQAGGVYWVPQDSMQQLDAVADAFKAANDKIKVYPIHTVMDQHAIEAVRDALFAEVTDILAKTKAELAENKLTERVLGNRKRSAVELHDRVKRFEEIFGQTLETLHDAVRATELELEAATALEDEKVFGNLFE